MIFSVLFALPAFAALEPGQELELKYLKEPLPVIRVAQQTKRFSLKIAPQPLGSALKLLNRQTGAEIAYPSITNGFLTNGVSGDLTIQEALEKLIKGTSAEIHKIGPSTLAIRVKLAQSSDILLDGITVYGEKTERDLQETTSSVQVFTQEDIENSTVENLNDIFQQSANVTTRSELGFTIRGITNTGIGGAGDAQLSGIFVDGVFQSALFTRNIGSENLWDVQQVEVLRGPQSTTQGRSTLAGAIIIDTNDPVYKNVIAARGGLETEDGGVFSALINAPIIDDKLAVRFAADFRKTDGFNRNITRNTDDEDFDNSVSLRGKILFEPSNNLKNLITVSYTKRREGNSLVDGLDPFARIAFSPVRDVTEADNLQAVLENDIKLNENWSIVNITSFTGTKEDSVRGLRQGRDALNFPNDRRDFTSETDIFSEELRFHYKGSKLKGHVGLFYTNETRDSNDNTTNEIADEQITQLIGGVLQQAGVSPADIPAATLATLPFYTGLNAENVITNDVDTDNYAIFSEFTYDHNPFLTIFGGLRYDLVRQERTRATSRREISNVAGLANPLNCGLNALNCGAVNLGLGQILSDFAPGTSKIESEGVLPSIGINLHWTEHLSTGFSVKRGFRAGGGGVTIIDGTPFEFDPEFVWNYELSLRSQWFDKKLTVNANAFFLDWTDQQVNVDRPITNPLLAAFPPGSNAIVANAGRSELRGFEVEVFAEPTEQLSLRGSVGYVETEFKEFVTGSSDFSGNEFINAPNWTLSASANYSFTNGIYLHGNVNYQSEAFGDAANNPDNAIDARTIVNAKIGYKKDNIDAHIYANNLFDEEYLLSKSGNSVAIPGDGQAFGVRFNMKLD